MTPQDLIAAFEALADAPDGVKRLRELVLQLAVRGKLVEQDPLNGRIRGSRHPPVDGEAPFEVPFSWCWMRLPEVSTYAVGKTPPTKDPRYWGDHDIPWVSISDMPNGGVVMSTTRTVNPTAAEEVFRKPRVPTGTLLMSFKLTIGKVAILGVDAYHNEAIISIVPNVTALRDYLFRVLPIMAVGGESKDAIKGATLNSDSLSRVLVPLPPLPEQHRIVARVDELMGLLDRLEAARDARDTSRRAARDSALASLRDAEDAEDVEAAWGRIAREADDLFTEPGDVGPIRQAILGLAVRGKLVAQDPGEPSLRGHFQGLPDGWTQGTMQEWFDVTGGIQKSGKRTPAGNAWPYLRVANVQRGTLVLEEITRFELFDGELERYRLARGDLLVVEGNGSESEIGRCARWNGEIENCVHQNHLIRCRPRVPDIEWYTLIYLNSPVGKDVMRSLAVTTSGLFNLSVGKIKAIRLVLPPLAEQRRIVAKVDALMALCDDLEARLTAARDLHGQFAAAAVHHLGV